MVTHQVLAMGAALLLSNENLQTTNPPALTGIWESAGCVIQELEGNANELQEHLCVPG